MNLPLGKNFLFRAGYIFAMYTGIRAVFNRVRSLLLSKPQAAILDGRKLDVEGLFQVKIRVHARVPPASLAGCDRAGMLSVWLVDSGMPWPLYGLLRRTSHFGCGHIEIAFYEEAQIITFYAVRNIVRSNAERIGCQRFLDSSGLLKDSDEVALLQTLSRTLTDHGLQTCFASPENCVAFSVNNQLLPPEKRVMIRSSLRKRYVRIWKRVQLASK